MQQQCAFRELKVVWSGGDGGTQGSRGRQELNVALLSGPLRLGLSGSQMKATAWPSLCLRQLSQALLPAVGERGLACGKGGSQRGGWGEKFLEDTDLGLLGKESDDGGHGELPLH